MKKFCVILLFTYWITAIQAQTIDGWFPFEISALDTFEVEFAPKFPLKPIEDDNFVSINSDGHFEINGEPVRFWGTPSYPLKEEWQLSQEEIKMVAREFRKIGVNIIRVHTMDSRPFFGENTIFGTQNTTRTLDPVQLDKMDYYISEFKKQGIYVLMDMLTDRQYTEEDGVYDPDSVYNAAKEVNFFDPYLIQLQKEYATQLLTHVNPYTGKALKDDPVLALIDIVNEGWFLHSVRCDEIKPPSEGGRMSQYHYDMLTGLWNDFLMEKYGTDQSLMESWGVWPTVDVEVPNSGFEYGFDEWDAGYYGNVVATMEISTTEVHTGNKSLHLNTSSTDGLIWECYANNSFSAEGGQIYTLSFWAKSENENTIRADILQTDWVAGADFTISGNEWKQYNFSFKASNEGTNNTSVLIQMGKVLGNFWLDDVTVIKGEEELHDGGSLAKHSIKLLRITQNDSEILKQRKEDQSEFYIKIQTDYFTEMYNFLKDELGVKIPITGSNYLVGIPDFYVQNCTDFVDNHGYWSYDDEYFPASMIGSPQFTNPMIDIFAGTRVKGKPLTASEYNYDLYNPCANEALFFLSAYGSFHQADMLMIHGYDYGPLVEGVFRSALDNYHRLYDKAMLPGFAYVYRNGLIAPAEQTVSISFTKENVNNLIFRDDQMWGTDAYPNDYPFELIYQHDVQTDFTTGIPYNVSDYPARSSSPYKTDTDEIEWDSTGIFSVNTPKFCAFVGQLDKFLGKTIGSIQIVNADKRCGVTLLSLDEKNINESQKMLLTLTTQQKHDEWQFNGYRDLNGHAPIMLEATEFSFNLKSSLETIRISWLDKHGNPSGYSEVFENNGEGIIPVAINTYNHNGIWFGIEKTKLIPHIDLVEFLSGEYPVIEEESTIQWHTNQVDSIDLYWSNDNGANLNLIANAVLANNDSLAWIVPDLSNDSCMIIAKSTSNYEIADTITFPIKKFSDTNLIKNGAFDNGMDYWSFYPDASEDVNYSTSNTEFKIQVNAKPEELWHYSLTQYDIYLEPGHYVLDFDMSLPEPNYTLAYFTFSNQNTWENIIEDDIIIYRWESNKHFHFEFNYSKDESIPLRFCINLGGVESSAVIDNIRLRKEITNEISSTVLVTFQVDMQDEEISSSGVNLNGSFCSWNPADAVQMQANGTVYSTTHQLPIGETIEYKFVNGAADNWGQYEILTGTSCAFGPDANRGFVVPEVDLTLDLVCFNFCEACSTTSIKETDLLNVKVMPNPTNGVITISGLPESEILINVFSSDGRLILEESTDYSKTEQIDISKFNTGVYYLNILQEGKTIRTTKIIKN